MFFYLGRHRLRSPEDRPWCDVVYELFVLFYSFISLVRFIYCLAERYGVSSVALDGLVRVTFVLCFGAGRDLDLALGGEGNWVVGMD